MMRVVFDHDTPAIEARAGDRLLDLCDEHEASIPFSCRDASCATCLVEVKAGAELLEPPRIHEGRLLARIRATASERLACQVVLGGGDGEVRVVPSTRL